MEKVKVIIDVRGGIVQAVYAGDFVQAVVIDHDSAVVFEVATEPLSVVEPKDTAAYDGGFPDDWNEPSEAMKAGLKAVRNMAPQDL